MSTVFTLPGQIACVLNIAAAPTGTTLFIENQSDTSGTSTALWRSDDAGQTWHQVFSQNVSGPHQFLATTTADGQAVLYEYANLLDSQGHPLLNATDIQASTDGGQTWTSAPKAGIPAGLVPDQVNFPAALRNTSDGSVVEGFAARNASSAALYAWKPGDASWHQLTITSPGGYFDCVVTPGSGSQPDTIRAITQDAAGIYSVYLFVPKTL